MSPWPEKIANVSVSSCWCGSECVPGGTRAKFAPTPKASTGPKSTSPRSMPNERCRCSLSYVLMIIRGSFALGSEQQGGRLGCDGRGDPVARAAGAAGEHDPPLRSVEHAYDRFP